MIDSTITVTGTVATVPSLTTTSSGASMSSFRLASTTRVRDRQTGEWRDGHTNWYSVASYRALADNVSASVQKGDAVLVTGALRVRPYEAGGRTGVNIDIDATHVGHDLFWGRSRWSRASRQAAASSDAPGNESEAAGDAGDAPLRAVDRLETPDAPTDAVPEPSGDADGWSTPLRPVRDEVQTPF